MFSPTENKNQEVEVIRISLGAKIERAQELHDGTFQVYFRLNPQPEVEWKLSFAMVWMKHFAKQTRRTANIERDLLLVECQLAELKELYPQLVWAVEAANQAEVERQERTLRKAQEEEDRKSGVNDQLARIQAELHKLA